MACIGVVGALAKPRMSDGTVCGHPSCLLFIIPHVKRKGMVWLLGEGPLTNYVQLFLVDACEVPTSRYSFPIFIFESLEF